MTRTTPEPVAARFPSEKMMVAIRDSVDALLRSVDTCARPIWTNDEDGVARWTKEDFSHLAQGVWIVRGYLICIWRDRFDRNPVPKCVTGWPDEDGIDSAITAIGDVIHDLYWAWRITGNLDPVPDRGMYEDYREEHFIEAGRPIPEVEGARRIALAMASDTLDRAILAIAGPPRPRRHSDR